MNNTYYYEAKDGRRFCWKAQPTFECPIELMVSRISEYPEEVPEEFARASEQLGIDMPLVLLRAHPPNTSTDRMRDGSGKLTNRCARCGASMKRLGFRVWVERDKEDAGAGGRIADRFGLNPPAEILVKPNYAKTKKEATEWAKAERDKADKERT